MTRDEFAPMMGFISAAVGVPMSRETGEVYFEFLADLPTPIVRAAVRQVLMNHDYPTLPPVGSIRKAAVALQSPPAVPGPEAWKLFLAAVRRYGSSKLPRMVAGELRDYDGETMGLASLPPAVAHAARCFGWQRLCDTTPEHIGIAERDFLQAYAALGKRDEQSAIMPPSVRAVAELASGIGGMPALPERNGAA